MRKVLDQKFFNRSALKIAPELLGKYLCRQHGRKKVCLLITEAEAYIGPRDKASHASRGRTKRNEPMFGEAGRWYVYFIYGMHWMLNIVTGPKDFPAAVLIRGVVNSDLKTQHFSGHAYSPVGELLCSPRRAAQGPVKYSFSNLPRLDGPAKLTKFLKINGRFNGEKASKKTGLWIENRGVKILLSKIKRTPRIGVDYAGEWTNKPYRFLLL